MYNCHITITIISVPRPIWFTPKWLTPRWVHNTSLQSSQSKTHMVHTEMAHTKRGPPQSLSLEKSILSIKVSHFKFVYNCHITITIISVQRAIWFTPKWLTPRWVHNTSLQSSQSKTHMVHTEMAHTKRGPPQSLSLEKSILLIKVSHFKFVYNCPHFWAKCV